MFNLKIVVIARKLIDLYTKILFIFIQIFLRYREKRSDYGLQIFEYFYFPWKSDKKFLNIYDSIKLYTLNPIYRIYTIYDLSKRYLKDGSLFLEVGSWRGGVSAMVCLASREKDIQVIACDTFKGVVNSSSKDSFFRNSEYKDASKDHIQSLNTNLNINIDVIEGIFPDSAGNIKFERDISLAHIDVDTYLSAKESFDFIFLKMKKGGVIILDDYGGWFTDGVTEFGNELKKRKDLYAVPNHLGQLIIFKI